MGWGDSTKGGKEEACISNTRTVVIVLVYFPIIVRRSSFLLHVTI